MNDLELLRAYEPVVRYTYGEMFFPAGVEEYLKRCSLWMRDVNGEEHLILKPGDMTIDNLASYSDAPAGATLYMKFVNTPMTALEYQAWSARADIPRFRAPGRLARVPLLSRIGDSFFDLSFFIRGTVPGGTTASAQVVYQQMVDVDPRRVYYGRVVREAGWIALHYLFFFPMNPWRSGYNGVNDHESDWEQVFVFLCDDEDGAPRPEWVAFASHDFKGDDLRRRWDDPNVTREGDHPVIFAGAGSHASYFEQGEYIMSVEPKFLEPVKKATEAVLKLWYETLGQGTAADVRRTMAGLSVPFVDYARGDGLKIGPGQDEPWTPVIISDADPWVNEYRGLWGLDTRDPFGGERAPAGPKYDRDGSIRMAWNDPLGWAGLDKLHPPVSLRAEIQSRIGELETRHADLDQTIDTKRQEVRALALDVEALRHSETAHAILEERELRLATEQNALQGMHRDASEIAETIVALREHDMRLARGDVGSPTAHLKHAHHPVPEAAPQNRVVEVWAAISGAVALLLMAALIILRPPYWGWMILGTVLLLGAVEAVTRRRMTSYLTTVVIGLAIVATGIMLFEFWEIALLVVVLGVVSFMIRDNLRELRAS